MELASFCLLLLSALPTVFVRAFSSGSGSGEGESGEFQGDFLQLAITVAKKMMIMITG